MNIETERKFLMKGLPNLNYDKIVQIKQDYFIGDVEIFFPYQFPVGSTTVDVIATDVNTLTSTCSFDVTVEDDEIEVRYEIDGNPENDEIESREIYIPYKRRDFNILYKF
jgi:hypothetical protein